MKKQYKVIEINPAIAENVKKEDGYCPCIIEHTADTKCMCKAFREQLKEGKTGKCLCGRYEIVEDGLATEPTINEPDGKLSRKEMENLMTSVDVHSGKGVKLDQGKPRWELIPYRELEEVVKVLTFGATKYAPNNWQKVPDARERYFGACLRHLTAWKTGEKTDKESKLSHLGHALCCILFMLWFDNEDKKEEK